MTNKGSKKELGGLTEAEKEERTRQLLGEFEAVLRHLSNLMAQLNPPSELQVRDGLRRLQMVESKISPFFNLIAKTTRAQLVQDVVDIRE